MTTSAERRTSMPRVFSARGLATLALACAGLGTACAQQDPPVAQTPRVEAASDAIAFVGARVVPMDREGVLDAHTVLVRDGRIVAVGPDGSVEVPDDAQRIEADGHWLMPGLAEMHGHIPGPDDAQYLDDVLFLYVSNGVTTVRNMAGDATHPDLRDRIAAGDVLGPRLAVATPWVSPQRVPDADAARRTVAQAQADGFDLIKLGSLEPDVYAALAEAAHAADLPFGGHIPGSVPLEEALRARQTSIDHFDRYTEFLVPPEARAGAPEPGFFGSGVVGLADAARIPEAVQRTLDAGTWNVPTLSLVEHLASPESAEAMIAWPEMRYMPVEVRDGWVRSKHEYAAREDFQPEATARLVELRQQLLVALHAAGAPIALGSDAPQFFNVPGFSIHHEMRMMAAAGLTPWQVLETGTVAPARYFDTPGEFGAVVPGARADLILLTADPLADLDNVRERAGVMVAGRWLPEDEIQERLDAIAARRAAEG
ncbi:amidohydrolase family protein [Luteimonas abyssi]|uniref:amidohydrolase family protein n=1 Tax=Luteimonas abyssi TaxID=1247514 RepID=UPI000737BCBF|nr:amidohydrolase family protein [Luteimonas abyssi]